jgi:hypothetical protein
MLAIHVTGWVIMATDADLETLVVSMAGLIAYFVGIRE